MSDIGEAVGDLLDKADELPHGPAKVAVLEGAVALADLHGDEHLGYEARTALLLPCYKVSKKELIVHFTWCLAYSERHPDRDHSYLLNSYRWVISSLPGYLEVSRAQIDHAIAEMHGRFLADGYSPRPLHMLRNVVARQLGDAAMAEEAFAEFPRHPKDEQSDDAPTEAAFSVYHYLFQRRDDEALAAARPFLIGRYTSQTYQIVVPKKLLRPLVRRGEYEEAHRLHRKSMKLSDRLPEWLGYADEHVEFLALVGDLAGAVGVFAKHFAAGLAVPGVTVRFPICLVGRFLTDRLTKAGVEWVPLRPPEGLLPTVDGRCRVAELAGWLTREVEDLASRIDARNDNDYHTREVARLAELNDLADRCAAEGRHA
jgi:hypothetical protein